MNYSKGISWFDDCRIPFVDENIDFNTILKQSEKNGTYKGRLFETEIEKKHYKPEGRFPANLLVSDDMLNDGSVSNSKYYNIDAWFDNLLENYIY